jgi:formate hydrogenlyase subunit 3/multisubunit Na+/H+ antiporter MnhD subunit
LFILLYLTGYGAALFVNRRGTFFILLCLASISGLPPFPVFFVKMYIIYGLVFRGFYGVFVGFLMFLTLLMSVGYLAYFFKTFLVLGSNRGFLV